MGDVVKLHTAANDHEMVAVMVTVTVWAMVPVGDRSFVYQAGIDSVQGIVEKLTAGNCEKMAGTVEVDAL